MITLTHKDFIRLSEFIQAEYGIKMPEVKKTLLESRLQKRLRLLEIESFQDYCDYLFSPEGMKDEVPFFIDKITTNKTDFFRENEHFNYLTRNILPEITTSGRINKGKINAWSAGCSTGEEPYTLAMVLNEFTESFRPKSLSYSILATDISLEVLQIGRRAVYNELRVEPVPLELKKKYLLRSKEKDKKLIKIVPELRKTVNFGHLNFMDSDFGLKEQMDIIFCRNVIIYFDKKTQEQILKRILRYLKTGGYFFQGHSETIQGMDLPLAQVFPTIYRKVDR